MKAKMRIALIWVVSLTLFSGVLMLAEWADDLDHKICEAEGMILVSNGKGANYCTVGRYL